MVGAPARSRAWDVMMVILLLGSVGLVFVYEALDPVSQAPLRRALEWTDLGLVVFFVAEWGWRVSKSRPAAGRYALNHAWELLGMVPLLAPLPSFLRALRLLRIVRILRVFGKVGAVLGTWQRIARDSNLGKIAAAAGSVTLTGATLVWALERDVNPSLAHFSEAAWWAIVTVTTVGYGDITPITTMGRFVAACLMVTGIGTIGLLASSVASTLIVRKDEAPTTGPLVSAAGSLARDLEILADLRRRGELSDAEFEAAKGRTLGVGERKR